MHDLRLAAVRGDGRLHPRLGPREREGQGDLAVHDDVGGLADHQLVAGHLGGGLVGPGDRDEGLEGLRLGRRLALEHVRLGPGGLQVHGEAGVGGLEGVDAGEIALVVLGVAGRKHGEKQHGVSSLNEFACKECIGRS